MDTSAKNIDDARVATMTSIPDYERCVIALGRIGGRGWRVECGYCGLVTEWAPDYGAHEDLALSHLQEQHGAFKGESLLTNREIRESNERFAQLGNRKDSIARALTWTVSLWSRVLKRLR